MMSNKSVNPIVAPEIKAKVCLKPLLIPDDIIMILTGPGVIDRTKAKEIMESKIENVI